METTRQQAMNWWNTLSKIKQDDLALDWYGSKLLWDEEIEHIYLKEIPPKKVYTEEKLREICHEVLNMGMTLRQNQLAGYDGKSGKELLDEYLNTTM